MRRRSVPVGLMCALLLSCGGASGDASDPTDTGGADDAQEVSETPAESTGIGSAAADFLRDTPYQNVILEADMLGVVSVTDLSVKDIVMNQLRELLDKPGTVSLTFDAPDTTVIPPAGGYTQEDIEALGELHATEVTEGDTVILHLLYLPGGWHTDTLEHRTLGVATGPRRMAVFPDNIEAVCEPGRARLETQRAKDLLCPYTEVAAILHELGHLLGLVDTGLPMVTDHRDTEHGHHCDDPLCVMHWSHESGKLAELRLSDGVESLDIFDDACQADMDAFRNGD